MKPSALSVLALSFSLASIGALTAGCAADATPEEDEAPASALESDLSSHGKKLVGDFEWAQGGGSAFVDFEALSLKADGTYTAKVDSQLVNPAVRCIRFPCTLEETGKWNAYKSFGKVRILVRPSSAKPWRYYAAVRNVDGLSLTRLGKTTVLTEKAPPASCAAMLCMVGTICVDGPNGGECKPAPTQTPCVKTGCSGHVCADSHRITTCEFRPEYACYQQATCERQADGTCGFTQTQALTDCLASK